MEQQGVKAAAEAAEAAAVEAPQAAAAEAQELPEPLPAALEREPITSELDPGMSEETVRWALENFKTRPTDVIVATFPKTGTTLVTWLCHQIRTNGDTDFEDIYQVMPWILLSWDLGMDPNVDGSQFTPRVFKSHLRLASVFPGCKYVVTLRDPYKVALSFYNFLYAKGVEAVTSRDVSAFVLETPFLKGTKGRPGLWQFYHEYFLCRDCSSVLVLVYEDVVKDMPGAIRLLADFMGVPSSPELVEKVAGMSTKEYMSQHESKMDESWVHARAVKLGRSPDNASMWTPTTRIVLGDHKQELNEEARAFLDAEWKRVITSQDGVETYEDLANIFRERNQKRLAELDAAAAAAAAPPAEQTAE